MEALDLVGKNESFAVSNGGGNKYKRMFPDSNTAETYNQQETKMKYTVQFGITPFVKEQKISDLANKPFSFKFDEITTTQIKKQYDADVTFFMCNSDFCNCFLWFTLHWALY